MITSIAVNGFKTLSRFYLELKPGLNILVGPNGSGKTNIISFFEFLAHLVEADASEATSRLGGAGTVFRRVEETYEPNITAQITGCYRLDPHSPFYHRTRRKTAEKFDFRVYDYEFTVLFSSELESVVFTKQSFRYAHSQRFVPAPLEAKQDLEWAIELEISLNKDLIPQAKLKTANPELLDFPFFHTTGSRNKAIAEMQEFLSKTMQAHISIPSTLIRYSPELMPLSEDITGGQTYNIIPSRVKLPEDSAKPPGIARDGSGLSATLYALKKRKVASEDRPWFVFFPFRRGSLKSTTLDTLKSYFHLANDSLYDVDVINDPFDNQLRVSFLVRTGDYNAKVPLSFMSDGTLKWLSLVTAALTASSVFSIEEPENYLHPQMQGQFVSIMREILFKERKNACTLMTTHSETLLNHCKPSELIVVSLSDGRTVAKRCANQRDISYEIDKTGFGLGYYYIAGAVQDD
jgi:predicted ATPase